MRRRLLACLLMLSLVACGDDGVRAPFAESRPPPSLSGEFLAPLGWAWGYLAVGAAPVQRYGVSAPPVAPRAQILILPGYGESAELWFETARDLNQRGYTTWILDRQGQGGSQRLAFQRDVGHVVSFAPDVTAVKAMVKAVIRPNGRTPLILLAHGDSGLVALRALEEGLGVDAAILSAPSLDLTALPRPKAQLVPAAQWARRLRLGFLRDPASAGWRRQGPDAHAQGLTHDPRRGAVGQAWQLANPDLRMGAPSLGWYAAYYDALDAVGHDLKAVKAPVAVLTADKDGATRNSAASQVCAALTACVQTRFPGAGHAIHLETDARRDPWLAAVETVVRARIEANTPGLGRRPPGVSEDVDAVHGL